MRGEQVYEKKITSLQGHLYLGVEKMTRGTEWSYVERDFMVTFLHPYAKKNHELTLPFKSSDYMHE